MFSLASTLLDPEAGKDLVVTTAPGYPIPERGARFAGGDVLRLPLREERGFLPDLDAITDEQWAAREPPVAQLPEQPDGRGRAAVVLLAAAAERCRAHDVVLASDEAYSELWFGDRPPASALQVGDLANVLVLNTLSASARR